MRSTGWLWQGAAPPGNGEFDRLVRNVYTVLLTRGMRSVRLYSTDPQTLDLLHELVDAPA